MGYYDKPKYTIYARGCIRVYRGAVSYEISTSRGSDHEIAKDRDEALEDIARQLDAAGLLPLIIARERLSGLKTHSERAAQNMLRARGSMTEEELASNPMPCHDED